MIIIRIIASHFCLGDNLRQILRNSWCRAPRDFPEVKKVKPRSTIIQLRLMEVEWQTKKRSRTTNKMSKRGVKRRRTKGPTPTIVYAAAPRGEMKWLDTDLDIAALTAAGQFVPTTGTLNVLVAGVGESQRVGRKVIIRKILLKYNLNLFAGISQANHEDVRVILYKDKQANGAIATVTTILQTDNFQSFRNMENTGRYQVLYDKLHAINHAAAGGNGTAIETVTTTRNYSFYKDCNIPIEYSGADGLIDKVRTNNLGILILGATGGVCKFEGICRLRYTD